MNNTVELIGHYGGDETHALSAWTSTRRELDDDRRERMGNMLLSLATNGHHTPFEKSYLHFLVTCDTASHIHLIKHRVGVSVNAESARYKELRADRYYTPVDWPDDSDLVEEFHDLMADTYDLYHAFVERLVQRYGIDRKRAKESARFVLPYANQLTLDIGFNFRSFMHFQSLRNSEHAQLEIREIAQAMLVAVWGTGDFDRSLHAFGCVKP